MKRVNLFFVGLMFLMLIAGVSAQVNVSYFYGQGCHYCAKVEASGILADVDAIDRFDEK